MAYGKYQGGNNKFQGQQSQSGQQKSQAPAKADAPQQEREENVGIAYLRTSNAGDDYFNIILKGSVPEGTKLVMFKNKFVKEVKENTPTHVIRISKPRD